MEPIPFFSKFIKLYQAFVILLKLIKKQRGTHQSLVGEKREGKPIHVLSIKHKW